MATIRHPKDFYAGILFVVFGIAALVIEVDDIRDAKVPPFDEVKPQLAQRMQGQVVDAYLKDLRAKNGM